MSILDNKKFNINLIFKESSLPRLETEILVSFLTKKSREHLLTHPNLKISGAIFNKYKKLELKRRQNWPIAYLVGHKEFYSLDLKVSPAVLTPRPETELIVDEVISLMRSERSAGGPLIIDVGTGSGAIIIAIAAELKRLFPARFKKTSFAAIDISAAALRLARQNAKKHQLTRKIKFYRGNLLTPLLPDIKKIPNRQLVITANLPYLTPAQIRTSPSIRREPKLALNGGKDGLKYYRELFRQLAKLTGLHDGWRLFCEIDPSQANPINNLAKHYFPAAKSAIKRDLAGRNRLLVSRSGK
ncbi:MAG: peptide chain release factor N(5)-glutamine methyltransferase [Patescibacteria group bacterium]